MKILLVDDVPMYLELLREPLARGGFSPVVASSAAEARAAFARHRPRLVIVDLHMPDQPGDQLCREMKAGCATPLAVVVMGVGGRDEDRRRARLAGCDQFLEKPVRPETALATAIRFLRVRERKPRVVLRVPVLYAAGGRPRIAQATNLSAGGLFLATTDPLPRGTAVTLELRLPLERSETPLRLAARVCWTTAEASARLDAADDGRAVPGMGLEFGALSEDARAALARFITRSLAAARLQTTRSAAGGRP